MCNCVNVKMGSYDNQVTLKMLNGELMGIDKCIAEEIQYLWKFGIRTTGCCCGHNIMGGVIGVVDEDIEIMKKGGYKVLIDKNNLGNENNFIPKSHGNEKFNYYDYGKDKNIIS